MIAALPIVRAEIEDLEARLAKLRQVESLLLDLDGEELALAREQPEPASPAPAAPPRPAPAQEPEADRSEGHASFDLGAAGRSGLGPRPMSIPLAELDSPTPQRRPMPPVRVPRTSDDDAKAKLREALVEGERTTVELLGAIGLHDTGTTRTRLKRLLDTIGAYRDGSVWTIVAPVPSNGHSPAAAPAGDLDGAYLERRILGELDRGMFTTGQLAEQLDAGTDDVKDALRRLSLAAAVTTTPDGQWTTV